MEHSQRLLVCDILPAQGALVAAPLFAAGNIAPPITVYTFVFKEITLTAMSAHNLLCFLKYASFTNSYSFSCLLLNGLNDLFNQRQM
jgi:hypothetical protein